MENLEGYIIQRWLPDGRHMGVHRLTFGRARLTISDLPPFADTCVADHW